MNICQWYIKKLGASWKEMVLESCVVDPQYEFGEILKYYIFDLIMIIEA